MKKPPGGGSSVLRARVLRALRLPLFLWGMRSKIDQVQVVNTILLEWCELDPVASLPGRDLFVRERIRSHSADRALPVHRDEVFPQVRQLQWQAGNVEILRHDARLIVDNFQVPAQRVPVVLNSREGELTLGVCNELLP